MIAASIYALVGLIVAAREVWTESRYRAVPVYEALALAVFAVPLWPLIVLRMDIGPRRRL